MTMKKTVKWMCMALIIALVLTVGNTFAYAGNTTLSYNADKAVKYAQKHWNDSKEYDGSKLDCVKFVKSCVEAGGVPQEAGRTWGYTPIDYVNYIIKNGYAEYYELKLTPHTWNTNRYYVDSNKNEGKIASGDILVYFCSNSNCPKPYFHLELVGDAEGVVTCYAHNTNKGNADVITFPHKACGGTDKEIEIFVLHFNDNNNNCEHKCDTYYTKSPATFDRAGHQTGVCTVCNEVAVRSIAMVKSPGLSNATYAFNNKTRTPAVYMKDTDGNLLAKTRSGSENGYNVKYASGRKNVGKYSVKVTLTGENYSGTKTVYFKINPAGRNISKISSHKKAFTVKWSKPTTTYRKQMTGYQIRYSTSSKMKGSKQITVKSTTAKNKKIGKLKSKKNYYVQLRTYKKIGSAYYYSEWSKIKKVKTK